MTDERTAEDYEDAARAARVAYLGADEEFSESWEETTEDARAIWRRIARAAIHGRAYCNNNLHIDVAGQAWGLVCNHAPGHDGDHRNNATTITWPQGKGTDSR